MVTPCRRSTRGPRSIGRAHSARSRDAGHRGTRCAPIRGRSSLAKMSAGRTATRFCCCVRCSRSSAIASSTRRSRKVPCSARASAPRSPASGRSARCSSTISSPPGSISSSTTRRRSAIAGADRCRWSCGCRGAGLRSAGPYHSQNTEAWFYRTPGLKIVVPSTPSDARALMASAVADRDPVLYYEHIALYRDPRIKQLLATMAPAEPLTIGRAALRREGDDLAIISYGAYVHAALRVAERLGADGIQASVLDLRSLVPLDRAAVLACARHCSRVLIVHEDSRTGGIGESLAAIIQEEAFESLDAPIRSARRARHTGAVLTTARGRVSAVGRGDRARGTVAGRLLMAGLRIAIVLQTPKDRHSSVYLTYQSLARELTHQGHQVAIVTPQDFPLARKTAGRWTPLIYPWIVVRAGCAPRRRTVILRCSIAMRDGARSRWRGGATSRP